jgi:hypothetical protein
MTSGMPPAVRLDQPWAGAAVNVVGERLLQRAARRSGHARPHRAFGAAVTLSTSRSTEVRPARWSYLGQPRAARAGLWP